MPLDDQRSRWIERTQYVRDLLDQFLNALPDDDRIAFKSTLGTIQGLVVENLYAGSGDAPPKGSVLAEAVDPFVAALGTFDAVTTAPETSQGFRSLLSGLRDAAQIAHLALTTDDRLTVQTIDDVIADFAQEYRISLILALTANHALTRDVVRWQESKDTDLATGDHLDLTKMDFVQTANERTIPMATLSIASTPDPIVITPENTAAMETLLTGGTPPPIYGMAYTQWFTNIHAAWEDTYRPRLAAAHGTDDDGKPWTKNDIRSEFFNDIRQIRHDISHKRGICVESADNTVIKWVEAGKPIAPTPRQMLGLLDLFPEDELQRTPTRVPRTTDRLPYHFDLEWIEKVKAHIEAIEPAKKKRPAVLQQVIDEWMTAATE